MKTHLERIATRGSALALVGMLAACASAPRPGNFAGGTMAPYTVGGVTYRPHPQPHYDEVGIATWYGAQYHHHMTSDGEVFDMNRPSGAHTTLPLPCIVEVTNLRNGRRMRVRINDRGPFVRGRILDLSREAAQELGFYQQGSTRVRVRYLGPAPRAGGGSLRLADAQPATPIPVMSPYSNAARVRVQAGAFADRANAQAVAMAVGRLGEVFVEPLPRGDGVLWRVIVEGPPDQSSSSLLGALAASGYPGARVLSGD